MKFMRTDFDGAKGPYSAEEAVAHQVERSTALTDGALERANAKIEELTGMVGRLLDTLPFGTNAEREAAARVIGYSWDPEPRQKADAR